MLGVTALQADISAVLVIFLGGILMLFAFGFRGMAKAGRADVSSALSHGAITIENPEAVAVNTEAARVLGKPVSDLKTLEAVFAAFEESALCVIRGAGGAATLRGCVDELVASGTRFQMIGRSRSGALIAAEGAPSGSRAVIRVRAATGQEMILAKELYSQRQARDQAEIVEALAEQGEQIAICLRPDGETSWHSAEFARQPTSVKRAILSLARDTPEPPENTEKDNTTEPHTFPLPDGEVLVLAPEVRPLSNGKKLWIGRDMSREVAAETALRRFVDTMADTFAHLKMSLLIFDRDRRLVLFNPATVDVIRMEAEWLAQRPSLKALLDRMREVRMAPEQADFIAWRDRVLQATAPSETAEGAAETSERMEDIWHLPNGVTLHVLARPHPSGGLAVVIEDISDTMALQRQSVSERAVHMATADLLKEAIIVFAPDGAARSANTAFVGLWGFDKDHAIAGQHVTRIAENCRAHAPDTDFWDTLIDCVTGQQRSAGLDAKIPLPDGRVMMARISLVPDGGVLAVFSDVTDSERMAEALTDRNFALEQTQEMRAALIDQISHQIRTPLNSISGFAQLLQERHFGELNDQQLEYVSGVKSAALELLNAIRGMTEIIDLDEYSEAATKQGANPLSILEDVVAIVNQRKGTELVRMVSSRSDAPPLARAVTSQQGHLRQIMFNLITDALSSPQSEEEASIAEVSVDADGETLVIECTRDEAGGRPSTTLAFAMAARLSRILGGGVTSTQSAERGTSRRVLQCRIPLVGTALTTGQAADPPAQDLSGEQVLS